MSESGAASLVVTSNSEMSSSATKYFENRDQQGRVEKITDYAATPEAGGEHGRFGYAEVYGEVGVVDLHQRRLRRRPAHALS